MNCKIGDSVMVKDGVTIPGEEHLKLDGWQGRIVKLDPHGEEILATIEWDAETLRNMSDEMIEESIEEGLDWTRMNLFLHDVRETEARDDEEEVKKVRDQIENRFQWISLGAQGKRIAEVLKGIDPRSEMEILNTWKDHLQSTINLPIRALVADSVQPNSSLQPRQEVQLKDLMKLTDLYGIIAVIIYDGNNQSFPLCDLQLKDRSSSAHRALEDYRCWFANR